MNLSMVKKYLLKTPHKSSVKQHERKIKIRRNADAEGARGAYAAGFIPCGRMRAARGTRRGVTSARRLPPLISVSAQRGGRSAEFTRAARGRGGIQKTEPRSCGSALCVILRKVLALRAFAQHPGYFRAFFELFE